MFPHLHIGNKVADGRIELLLQWLGRLLVRLLPNAELLNVEIFNSLREAQILIENWRRHYNTIRPHSALGYRPPAPEIIVPAPTAWPAAQPRPAPPATLPLASRPALN